MSPGTTWLQRVLSSVAIDLISSATAPGERQKVLAKEPARFTSASTSEVFMVAEEDPTDIDFIDSFQSFFLYYLRGSRASYSGFRSGNVDSDFIDSFQSFFLYYLRGSRASYSGFRSGNVDSDFIDSFQSFFLYYSRGSMSRLESGRVSM